MVRKTLALATVIILALSLAGCQTESGYYSPGASAGAGALGGAATGAALGAIIGAATGSPATGAWIGAASGALVGGVGGYLYAQHKNSEINAQQAAASQYGYNASMGNVVSVDSVYAQPSMVYRGQSINLGMTYTILTPDNAPASITVVRELRYNGQVVGPPYQNNVTNYNGTYSDSVAYTVPNNAGPGTYTVTSRVISSVGSAERETYFTVQ
jgi:hypothetical protein